MAPLHKISRKNCNFIWNPIHESAFSQIKNIIMSEQVLSLPTKEGLFRLHVDSSKCGTGAMLTQIQNEQERVLSFYSKLFPDSASRYSISKLELFGIWTSVKAYRHMLRGHKFQVVSDHSSLVQIISSKHPIPSSRLRKFLEKLSDYNFDLVYKKGSEHVIPDFLSRCPTSFDDEPIAFSSTEMINCMEFSKLAETLLDRVEQETIAHGYAPTEQLGDEPTKQTEHLMPVTRANRAATGAVLMGGLPAPTRAKRVAAAPAPVAEQGPVPIEVGREPEPIMDRDPILMPPLPPEPAALDEAEAERFLLIQK